MGIPLTAPEETAGHVHACDQCKRQAVVRSVHAWLCADCLDGVVERRLKQDMTEQGGINAREKVLFLDTGTKEAALGRVLLKRVLEGLPYSIDEKKVKSLEEARQVALPSGFDKVVVPADIDDEVDELMNAMTERMSLPKMPEKTIILFRAVMDNEIRVLAQNMNLMYAADPPHSELRNMLNALEERYPGSKFGMLKSGRVLMEAENAREC